MNFSPPTRRLAPLLLFVPAALALTSCGTGHQQLSPEQMEAALLTESEFPLAATADVATDDAVTLTPGDVGFGDYDPESVDASCADALTGVYPTEGVQAPMAIGDYATGEQRVLVRIVSLPGGADLNVEEGFAAIGDACDGQTLTDSGGGGFRVTGLDDGDTAGFRQSVVDASPLLEGLMSRLATHRLVAQDGNDVVEVFGVGLAETEAREILDAQTAKLTESR